MYCNLVNTGDPSEWPEKFKELKEVDTILRCGVCYEVMETTMMLQQCSHNYCSLCIRKYLTFKTQCPTCRVTAVDSDLKNNRAMDDLIKQFYSVRNRLLKVLTSTTSSSILNNSKESSFTLLSEQVESTPVGKINEKKSPASLIKTRKIKLDYKDFDYSDDNSDEDFIPIPSSSKKRKAVQLSDSDTEHEVLCRTKSSTINVNNDKLQSFTPAKLEKYIHTTQTNSDLFQLPPNTPVAKSPGSVTEMLNTPSQSHHVIPQPSASASKRVNCPVCSVSLPERHINLHLDRCLSNLDKPDKKTTTDDTICSTLTQQKPKRKLMPKLVYNILSEKELRKKLTEVGLPTQGTRQALIKRHQELTLQYNAQCDSLNPKSVEELVKEMQKAERTKNQLFSSSAPGSSAPSSTGLKIEKSASVVQVDAACKSYAKQHKSQFAQLIAETKMRMKKKRQEELAKKQAENDKQTPACSDNNQDLNHHSGQQTKRDDDKCDIQLRQNYCTISDTNSCVQSKSKVFTGSNNTVKIGTESTSSNPESNEITCTKDHIESDTNLFKEHNTGRCNFNSNIIDSKTEGDKIDMHLESQNVGVLKLSEVTVEKTNSGPCLSRSIPSSSLFSDDSALSMQNSTSFNEINQKEQTVTTSSALLAQHDSCSNFSKDSGACSDTVSCTAWLSQRAPSDAKTEIESGRSSPNFDLLSDMGLEDDLFEDETNHESAVPTSSGSASLVADFTPPCPQTKKKYHTLSPSPDIEKEEKRYPTLENSKSFCHVLSLSPEFCCNTENLKASPYFTKSKESLVSPSKDEECDLVNTDAVSPEFGSLRVMSSSSVKENIDDGVLLKKNHKKKAKAVKVSLVETFIDSDINPVSDTVDQSPVKVSKQRRSKRKLKDSEVDVEVVKRNKSEMGTVENQDDKYDPLTRRQLRARKSNK